MTVTPSSTLIERPSISTVGMAAWPLRGGAERAAPEAGVLLELGLVLGDERADGHGGGLRERADRVALHVVRDPEQEVDVRRRRAPGLELLEHPVQPAGALTTRRTLATRLVMEETFEDQRDLHHADGVVHHHDAGRPEERPRLL